MDTLEDRYIYRASIRLRNGRRIFAWQYGLKAFRIRLKHDQNDQPRLPGI
jgi:hypothetical protein